MSRIRTPVLATTAALAMLFASALSAVHADEKGERENRRAAPTLFDVKLRVVPRGQIDPNTPGGADEELVRPG